VSKDYIHKARGVSSLKCHLVLTTKYRRKVLTDVMLTRLGEIFTALMEKWEAKDRILVPDDKSTKPPHTS
jgi:putative transposase